MTRSPIVTLTTDFGVADGYVGTIKGVLLDIAPEARLVDITHQIAPQAVRQTAFILYTTYRFFPSQAVHLVVVDPGVGSARRSIAVKLSHGTFVGPDNGVFNYVMAEESVETVVELADPCYRLPSVSETFHGRDIFAPAAAHLAAGVSIDQLGPAVPDPVTLPLPRLEIGPRRISGEVLHVDHFGNVITSIGRLRWTEDELVLEPAFQQHSEEQARFRADSVRLTVGEKKIERLGRTYADVGHGNVLALVGSEGHLEIAVREGSGADELGLQPRDLVELRW
ncbi:MAG: SAM-dependent chlorinase/fluorinase [Anaerolineae bacterium]|jgi:S-adenosylmethionine hydrolase